MIKRRWATDEDAVFLKAYDDLKKDGLDDFSIFESIASSEKFRHRTTTSLEKRYYTLKNGGNARKYIKKDEQYNVFLDGLQTLKKAYDDTVIENKQLKKRIAELEQNQTDYEALARVMDAARKLVVNEEIEKPRFKMDSNGNLERV